MHLLETYALSTGSKIKKPFILKKYFPLPFNKYITIQNSSGMPGKCYSYFQEVVDFIKPILNEHGYNVIQIGGKEDLPLKNVINLQGQTNINQTAYILDNSKLHISNDSFSVHIASFLNIPLIALYSVSSPKIAGPFWKNKNQICLTPHNWKPSFNPNENPKRINEIKIENIISSIEKLLFNNKTINLNTLHIGERYGQQQVIECTPDQFVGKELGEFLLNIRLDYFDKEIDNNVYNIIVNNASIRQCAIITNKPFFINPLNMVKNNIQAIFYNITNDINLDFLKTLSNSGFKYFLIFDKESTNEEVLNQRKLETIDFTEPVQIFETPNVNINIDNNTFYKSNKLLLSNNKFYISRVAHIEDKPVDNPNNCIQNLSLLKDKNLFLKEDILNSFIYNID